MGGDVMKKLKLMRLKYKLNYQKMANLVGISRPFYWQIENDDRRLSYEMAVKIARVFHTTTDEIFYDDMVDKINKKFLF